VLMSGGTCSCVLKPWWEKWAEYFEAGTFSVTISLLTRNLSEVMGQLLSYKISFSRREGTDRWRR
jgi:hypothetical protein